MKKYLLLFPLLISSTFAAINVPPISGGEDGLTYTNNNSYPGVITGKGIGSNWYALVITNTLGLYTNLSVLVPGPGGFETNTYLLNNTFITVKYSTNISYTNNIAYTNVISYTNAVNYTNTVEYTNSVNYTNTVEYTNTFNYTNTVSYTNVVNYTNIVESATNYVNYTNTVEYTNDIVLTNNNSLAGIVVGYGIGTNLPAGMAFTNNTDSAGVVVGNGIGTNLPASSLPTAIYYPSGTNAVTATTGTEITMSGPTNETWMTAAPGIIQFSVPQGNVPVGGGGEFWIRMNTGELPNYGGTQQTVFRAQGNVINLGDSDIDTNVANQTINLYGWSGINFYGPVDYTFNSLQLKSSDSTVQALRFSDTKGSLTNGLFTGNGAGLTNLNPTQLTTTDGLAPVAISGWVDGDLVGIFTNSIGGEAKFWYENTSGYFFLNGGVASAIGFAGEGSELTNVLGSIVIAGTGISITTNTIAATGQKTYTITQTSTNETSVTNVTLRAGAGVTVTTNAATDWTVATVLTNSTTAVGVVGTASIGTNTSALAVLAATTNHFIGNAGWDGSVTAKQYDTTTNSNSVVPDFTLSANYFATNASFSFLVPSGVDMSKQRFQETVCIVTNSSGSLLTVTAPWLGTHVQGKWFVTNVTTFHFCQYGQLWTNGIACPRW